MREDRVINFDTFYFLELLESIRNKGQVQLSKADFQHLTNFLHFLGSEPDVHASIEKLANYQSTGDLSLFFSDIIEQLHQRKPEESLTRLSDYTSDFLEIFNVLLEDRHWLETLQEQISPEAREERPQTAETDIVNFEEYVRYTVTDKIEKVSATLASNIRELFRDFLLSLLEHPRLLDNLHNEIADPLVENFMSIHHVVQNGRDRVDDLDIYIQTFDRQLDTWARLFASILEQHSQKIERILGEFKMPATPEYQEADKTLEEMFDRETEATTREKAEAEIEAGSLDELTERLKESDSQRQRRAPESPEEQQRRQILRDYVVQEVNGFREEILENYQKVVDDSKNQSHRMLLLDSLKSFKDLGQIHGYPGLEISAEYLLGLFQKYFKADKRISPRAKAVLEELFQAFPGYIDARLRGEDAAFFNSIEEILQKISLSLPEKEDVFDLHARDNLRAVFQEIVDRYSDLLLNKIQSKPLESWSEEQVFSILPVFENLKYWSNLLELSEAVAAVSSLERLITSMHRQALDDEVKQYVSEFIAGWKGNYVTLPAETWNAHTQKLSEFLARYQEVPVEEALSAFQEVTIRKLDEFIAALSEAPETTAELVTISLPSFFNQLKLNTQLIRHEALFLLAQKCLNQLSEMGVSEKAIEEANGELFRDFLKIFKRSIAGLPGEADWQGLFERFASAIQSLRFRETREERQKEIEVAEAVAGAGEADITDEQIEQVFLTEAEKYIEELKENLQLLLSDISRFEIWHKVGVLAHTLNGSAQMTGHRELVNFTDAMENAIEMVEQKQISPSRELVDVLLELNSQLFNKLSGKAEVPADVLPRLKEVLEKNVIAPAEEVEETPASEIIEQAVREKADESAEEKATFQEPEAEAEAIIRLKEQDPELLKIYQDEVRNNYELVDRNLTNLEKFTFDRSAWQEIERGIHEIHTAAKMLGVAEIGFLAQQMESVVEKVLQEKISQTGPVIPLLRRAIYVVRELTQVYQVDRTLYDDVLEGLTLLLEEAKAAAEEKTTEPAKPTEEVAAEAPEEPAVVQSVPQLKEMFVREARELLDDINYLLLKLEKDPDNGELQHHLMRSVHTLKGSAGVLNAAPVEKITHIVEDILEKYVELKKSLPEELFDYLFAVVDEITFMVDSFQAEGEIQTQKFDELISKLTHTFEELQVGEEAVIPTEEVAPEPEPAPASEPESGAAEEEYVSVTKEEEKVQPQAAVQDTSIRLDIRQMDYLLNLSAELVIGHTQFKNQLDRLKNFVPMMDSEVKVFRETETHLNAILQEARRIQDVLSSKLDLEPGIQESLKNQLENLQRIVKNLQAVQNELLNVAHSLKDDSKNYEESLQKLNNMSNNLLDAVMKARLVPINVLFTRFQRPIRDLARSFKKKINLRITGENTELDRTLVEELYEPLLHIIRNSIDHGIETIEERKAKGKSPEGMLSIKASRERNQVIIEIQDDGRGIDLEKVKEKAIEQGYLTREEAAKVTEHDLYDFLFYPGFTTTTETTLVSGRGVGLDAVKAQIEKIKGDIRIQSEKGKGTTIVIRVPVSLSVIQSMLVDAGGHIYSIPLFQVEETLNVSVKDLTVREGIYYMHYREKQIPVIQLSRLLVVRGAKPRPISVAGVYPAIIVQDEGRRVALLVDKIVRREEILIKSLGLALRRLKYITGGSIMADGQVVLVLDIPQIIQDSLRKTGSEGKPEPSLLLSSGEGTRAAVEEKRKRKKVVRGRRPAALVVDDSLSIRKYLSNLLMQKGFVTETARNGYEALELLNSRSFDIMVTDLEMPKLSGYELIEAVRMDEKYQDFPIIVLTGRASADIRQMTKDLGADAYIIKPFKDKELLDQVQKFVDYQS